MKEESIKIEIEDKNEEVSLDETVESLNENDVEEDKNMVKENKTVVKDFNDEELVKMGVEDEEMDLFFILDRSGSMYGTESDTINDSMHSLKSNWPKIITFL
ncbi:MAG: hypothetical protein Q4P11_05915 [Methanobrevibacter sp.]|nr:hypothetical protein [Methanobrevibacter sp.]